MGVEAGGFAVEAGIDRDELMDAEGAMDVNQMEATVDEVEKLLVARSDEATREFWMRAWHEGVSGGRIWFQVEAFGSAFWEGVPETPVCDISGQAMEPKAHKDALIMELAEVTRLKVGRFVSERDGRAMAHKNSRMSMGLYAELGWKASCAFGDERLQCGQACLLSRKSCTLR